MCLFVLIIYLFTSNNILANNVATEEINNSVTNGIGVDQNVMLICCLVSLGVGAFQARKTLRDSRRSRIVYFCILTIIYSFITKEKWEVIEYLLYTVSCYYLLFLITRLILKSSIGEDPLYEELGPRTNCIHVFIIRKFFGEVPGPITDEQSFQTLYKGCKSLSIVFAILIIIFIFLNLQNLWYVSINIILLLLIFSFLVFTKRMKILGTYCGIILCFLITINLCVLLVDLKPTQILAIFLELYYAPIILEASRNFKKYIKEMNFSRK